MSLSGVHKLQIALLGTGQRVISACAIKSNMNVSPLHQYQGKTSVCQVLLFNIFLHGPNKLLLRMFEKGCKKS